MPFWPMAIWTSLFIMSSMFCGVPAVACADALMPSSFLLQIWAIAFPMG